MPRFCRLLLLASLPVFLSACGGPPPPAPVRNEQADSPNDPKPDRPDAVAVAQLVKSLGSSNFAEREAATKALEVIGFPALHALRTAARSGDAEVAQRATRLVEHIENGFDQLLVDYRAHGLPEPPKDAKLVRFVCGGCGLVNGERSPLMYLFGFMLEPATQDQPPLLLVGTQEYRLDARTPFELVEPDNALLKDLDPEWRGPTFAVNAGLALAIQSKARGWNKLAKNLWAASIGIYCGHRYSGFYHRGNLPNRTAVAYLAWTHYANELVKPGTDRPQIARRIKALFAAEKSLNTEGNRKLLQSLEAALAPSTAQPGTVERLIDELKEMCANRRNRDESDPQYSKLEGLGFAAVPALIAHLDDERLTRSHTSGFNNFPPWIRRIQDVVSDLLQELAGDELGKDWLRRRQGWAVEKADAQKWWDDAQKVGEEAYVARHVLPSDVKAQWPNALMLRLIADRYPQHLATIYQTILDKRPHMQSWPVAEAISKSSLPGDKKQELFLKAATHANLEHRRFGLEGLQKFDPKRFTDIVVVSLEAMPATPAEPYWTCPEIGLAYLVLATDDPQVWKKLHQVAKRSDVGLRMELLSRMHFGQGGEGQRQQRLEFLAAFLDDAEVRDESSNPKLFTGPYAGFTFRRLTVRDFAATQIASMLKVTAEPNETWTPEQWEVLRMQVKQALARERP